MQKLILSFLVIAMSATVANAEHRTKHYQAVKPQNSAQAMEILNLEATKINALIRKNEKLSENDLEAIHELTYSMEESHKVITKQNKKDPRLHELGEAIEQLHNVSEGHDGAATIKSSQQLIEQVQKLGETKSFN